MLRWGCWEWGCDWRVKGAKDSLMRSTTQGELQLNCSSITWPPTWDTSRPPLTPLLSLSLSETPPPHLHVPPWWLSRPLKWTSLFSSLQHYCSGLTKHLKVCPFPSLLSHTSLFFLSCLIFLPSCFFPFFALSLWLFPFFLPRFSFFIVSFLFHANYSRSLLTFPCFLHPLSFYFLFVSCLFSFTLVSLSLQNCIVDES